MQETGTSSLMQRLAISGGALEMTVARALETAITRAIQTQLEREAVVDDVIEARKPARSWIETIPENALLLQLSGPGGLVGAAVLTHGLWSGFVSTVLTGRLAQGDAAERPPTRVDADLAIDLVAAILRGMSERMPADSSGAWVRGFHVKQMMSDPMRLGFILPEGELNGISVGFALSEGGNSAQMTLILPDAPERVPPKQAGAGADAGAAGPGWSELLKTNVMSADLPLNAVLGRQRFTLAEVAGWAPGKTVMIPEQAIASVRLEASDGAVLAWGRLGQSSGQRAVKLAQAIQAGATGLLPSAPETSSAVDTQGTAAELEQLPAQPPA